MSKKKEQARKENATYRNQLVTIEDLANFKEELVKEIKALLDGTSSHANKEWLKSSEVRNLLSISPGTLQTLRVNGTLPFQKVGGTIYYKWKDIENIMNKNDNNFKKGL